MLPPWTDSSLQIPSPNTNLHLNFSMLITQKLPKSMGIYQKDEMLEKRKDALENWSQKIRVRAGKFCFGSIIHMRNRK